MTDIVERLRRDANQVELADSDEHCSGLVIIPYRYLREAADEITRLRADNGRLRESETILREIGEAMETHGYANMTNGRDIGSLLSEITRLRAALKNIIAGNGGECGCAESARAALDAKDKP
jgi:hypothetical protein